MGPGETKLTDRELDVMSILWQRGSGTVAEVRKALADRLAYTTVLWALQTLEEKGHVRHEKEGRAYRYYPVVQQETAGGSALNRLVDKVFHGSASMLLAQLVSERDLPPDELQRMRDLLDRRLAGGKDG
jgi:predicted transcriptional regulator